MNPDPMRAIAVSIAAGDSDTALRLVDEALDTLSPAQLESLLNLSASWAACGEFTPMWQLCEKVATKAENGHELYLILAQRALLYGDDERAQHYAQCALARNAKDPYAQTILCQLLMKHTAFREGREFYEIRFDARNDTDARDWRDFPAPRWQGEPVAGKRLYLWTEQGIGDILMFLSFLPGLIAQDPAAITVGTHSRLIPLLARAFPSVTFESNGRAFEQASAAMLRRYPLAQSLVGSASTDGLFDFAGPIGDVMVYGMPEFIPAERQESYLMADAARVAGLREQLGMQANVRHIGLSWYTPNMTNGVARSVPPELLAPLMAVPNCRFYSLQHAVDDAALAEFRAKTSRDIVPPNFDLTQDFEGLAALIAAMDEVITIDNTNAHLAGALGVPTMLLLHKGCNFRWSELPGGATLWYRSVHALRQETALDWRPVIAAATAALAAR